MSYFRFVISSEDIKDWLKREGKNRDWLAQKTFSTKKTVDGWLSARKNIPAAKLELIKGLMMETGVGVPLKENTLILEFSTEEWAIVEGYTRTHPRFDPKTFAEQKLIEFCAEVGEKENAQKQSSDTPPPSQPSRQNDPTLIRGLDSAEETSA